jgi:hypothetical protein
MINCKCLTYSHSIPLTDIFDVYNIETALPVIDLAAIESHLMAAKEEEQKVSRHKKLIN